MRFSFIEVTSHQTVLSDGESSSEADQDNSGTPLMPLIRGPSSSPRRSTSPSRASSLVPVPDSALSALRSAVTNKTLQLQVTSHFSTSHCSANVMQSTENMWLHSLTLQQLLHKIFQTSTCIQPPSVFSQLFQNKKKKEPSLYSYHSKCQTLPQFHPFICGKISTGTLIVS